jgi:hypothetical protein
LIDQDYQLLQAVLFQLQLVLAVRVSAAAVLVNHQVIKAAIPYLVL